MARRKKIGELRPTETDCFYCNAIIPEDSLRCPSCGHLFKAAKMMMVFAVVVIVALAGMSFVIMNWYLGGHDAAENELNPIDGTPVNKIVFELKEAEAPNTCANFKKYVNDGFYSGLIFHRVIDSFMIQGGGFYQDLTQKTATYAPISLEISPSLRHVDGAVAMARTNDPNSATCQFYICDGAQSTLDDQYAVFGQVVSGMEHVRAISAVQTGTQGGMDDVPVNDVTIVSATLSTSSTGTTLVTLVVIYSI
jgi:cyclophilin family peptidyl-prolyl cis-trans isomerase